MRGSLVHPWTVYITLRVWPDREDTAPILDEIEHALRPIIGEDESMHVELVERSTDD